MGIGEQPTRGDSLLTIYLTDRGTAQCTPVARTRARGGSHLIRAAATQVTQFIMHVNTRAYPHTKTRESRHMCHWDYWVSTLESIDGGRISAHRILAIVHGKRAIRYCAGHSFSQG